MTTRIPAVLAKALEGEAQPQSPFTVSSVETGIATVARRQLGSLSAAGARI